jgi:hypothetical protein
MSDRREWCPIAQCWQQLPFRGNVSRQDSSGPSCPRQFNHAEIIALDEHAHAAQCPTLGVHLLRDRDKGKLYVLEVKRPCSTAAPAKMVSRLCYQLPYFASSSVSMIPARADQGDGARDRGGGHHLQRDLPRLPAKAVGGGLPEIY